MGLFWMMILITHESIIANVCKRNGKQWAECLNINRSSYQILSNLRVTVSVFISCFFLYHYFSFCASVAVVLFSRNKVAVFQPEMNSGLLNNKTIFYSSQQNLEKQTGNCLQSTAWKVPNYGVFFWSVFSCIRTEYRKIRTRKNSVLGGKLFTQWRFHLV